MNKHTPGPWNVLFDDTGGPFTGWPSVEASDELDCSIVHRAGFKQEYWGDLSQREAIANARLIAAAPDLLDALESVWLWMENQADGQSKGGHATFDLMMLREQRDIARAAIAKATGEMK